jgi:hypothetical protein
LTGRSAAPAAIVLTVTTEIARASLFMEKFLGAQPEKPEIWEAG